ncbi:MAG TPA: pitrilysin family protein [Gaiellales bacterium]|jgi:predicted Zn-dependent peptidase|nr:pitrilysin family protein [Gaiellales bacterium]
MFTKTELPNGLRVVTHPMDSAKSVAVMVMLAAGSRYETKDSSGIAHFAEHMFFKGTEKRPTAKDISAEVDGIGGEFNAFTGKEYTGYYIKCAAEHRELALDVLSDQLLASRFDPDEIEREKGVIIEELNMYVDTPRDHVDDVYERLLFGDQPLGWHIIGRKETIRAATRDTFLNYLNTWYTPRRMVVGAAGAVNGDFAAEVRDKFGHLEDRASGEMAPVEFVQTEPRVMLDTRDSDQAHLRFGVRGLQTTSPDRYVMQVLTTVLGGGMSSRLFLEVRERLGLAYYVYGYHQTYHDTGTLYAQAGVDVERIDQAIGVIAEQFRKMASEPVAEDELRRCKNYLKGRMVLQLEDPKGLLMFGLRREVLEDKVVEIDQVLEGIERVTAEDIQRLARQVIVDDGLNLAIVGPFDDEQRFLDVMAEPATVR